MVKFLINLESKATLPIQSSLEFLSKVLDTCNLQGEERNAAVIAIAREECLESLKKGDSANCSSSAAVKGN